MIRVLLLELSVHLFFLLALPWLLWQGLCRPGYLTHLRRRFWPETPAAGDERPVVLIHACSVGENLAIFPLISRLRAQRPDLRIVHTATTDTGLALARERSAADFITAWPLENFVSNRRFLRLHRPILAVIAETELWPDMLLALRSRGIPVVVVNGRLSDRSWPRYRRLRWLLAPALQGVNAFLAQSHEDTARAVQIGIPPRRVLATGNVKFDALAAILHDRTPAPDFGFLPDAPVFVFGSVHPGEENAVLAILQMLQCKNPAWHFIIAPRKLDRLASYLERLQGEGIPFARRSRLDPGERISETVLILDTMGELVQAYRRAVAAFVGGSFIPQGGHNLLEVSAAGRFVYFGPHMHNFREIEELVLAEGIGRRLETVGQALSILARDLAAPEALTEAGERGRAIVASRCGATARILHRLSFLLPPLPGETERGN